MVGNRLPTMYRLLLFFAKSAKCPALKGRHFFFRRTILRIICRALATSLRRGGVNMYTVLQTRGVETSKIHEKKEKEIK